MQEHYGDLQDGDLILDLSGSMIGHRVLGAGDKATIGFVNLEKSGEVMMMMISTCVVSLTNPPPLPVFSHSHNKKNKNIIISSSSAATPTTHFGLGAAYPFDKRTKGQTFRVFTSSSRSRSGDGSSSRMVMVDPLEAKRLAAVQMEEIQAREKFKRQRRIEAINGAWAMIGLTAGLVIEGQTGKSILDQLADYWSSVGNFFPIDAFSWGRLKQVCEDLQVTCWFIE